MARRRLVGFAGERVRAACSALLLGRWAVCDTVLVPHAGHLARGVGLDRGFRGRRRIGLAVRRLVPSTELVALAHGGTVPESWDDMTT